MTRPYAVKGIKLKKRPRLEPEVENEEERKQLPTPEEEEEEYNGGEGGGGESTPKGVSAGDDDRKAEVEEDNEAQMARIPIMPILGTKKQPGAIFVLDRASLEVAKVGKNFQILNSDDHANFLKKKNRNPADYRPDIVHQALLAILDSPLTKAGRLQALYVRTEKGVLFEVKPHVRMPRTFKRFCGLMLHLLQKLSITATGTHEKLLNVIKNPIVSHLPVNSRIIGLSHSSEKVVHMRDYVVAASDDINLVFMVGAMAHGKISNESTDDFISISNYPLSAACCLGRICNALERKWKIL